MRYIVLVMLFASFLFALEYTQDDRDRLIRLEIKVDEMGKRFEDKFGSVDKRFEQIDRRFEQVQAQIEQTNNIMTAMVAGIFAMIGFMWWDRRTLLAQAKEEMRAVMHPELDKKADSSRLEKILDSLVDYARTNSEFRAILEKHNLKVA